MAASIARVVGSVGGIQRRGQVWLIYSKLVKHRADFTMMRDTRVDHWSCLFRTAIRPPIFDWSEEPEHFISRNGQLATIQFPLSISIQRLHCSPEACHVSSKAQLWHSSQVIGLPKYRMSLSWDKKGSKPVFHCLLLTCCQIF